MSATPSRRRRLVDLGHLDRAVLSAHAVGEAASKVAVIPEVRKILVDKQREFARAPPGAVLDGRDIGTVVCPDADVKLYVTASAEVRARRRLAEIEANGGTAEFATSWPTSSAATSATWAGPIRRSGPPRRALARHLGNGYRSGVFWLQEHIVDRVLARRKQGLTSCTVPGRLETDLPAFFLRRFAAYSGLGPPARNATGQRNTNPWRRSRKAGRIQEIQCHKLTPPATISRACSKNPSRDGHSGEGQVVQRHHHRHRKGHGDHRRRPEGRRSRAAEGIRRQGQGRPAQGRRHRRGLCRAHRERAWRSHAVARQGSPRRELGQARREVHQG